MGSLERSDLTFECSRQNKILKCSKLYEDYFLFHVTRFISPTTNYVTNCFNVPSLASFSFFCLFWWW